MYVGVEMEIAVLVLYKGSYNLEHYAATGAAPVFSLEEGPVLSAG